MRGAVSPSRALFAAVLGLVAATLTGCAAGSSRAPQPAEIAVDPPMTNQTLGEASRNGRARAVPPKPVERPEAPIASVPPADAPADTPESLIGKAPEDAERMLGPPTAVADVPPARSWTWEVTGCRLHVFYYLDLTTNRMKALAYDMEVQSTLPNAVQRCFSRLKAKRGDVG